MNIFALHNVELSQDLLNRGYTKESLICSFSPLHETIETLALKYPSWTFKVITAGGSTGDVRKVRVVHDRTVLGTIGWEYRVGSSAVLVIHNDRIANKMERQNSMKTGDPKKAIAIVKKWFHTKTPKELVAEATLQLDEVLSSQRGNTHSKFSITNNRRTEAMIQFISQPDVYQQFVEYSQRPSNAPIANILTEYEDAKLAMMTVADVYDEYKNNNGVLVVRFGREYIVRRFDAVNIYDDTNLPHDLMGKLGMLKLVEPSQIVSNCGCRVADDIFFITTTDTDEPPEA